jgi:CrcB protein
MNWLAVAIGSAIGGLARYGMTIVVTGAMGPRFPWATLFINIIGSFIIAFYGVLSLPTGAAPAGDTARVFVLIGLCGGFTTFSSFSLQTLELLQGGRLPAAAAYVGLSVFLCVLGAFIGFWFAQRMG